VEIVALIGGDGNTSSGRQPPLQGSMVKIGQWQDDNCDHHMKERSSLSERSMLKSK
jgi:hypothetical protein